MDVYFWAEKREKKKEDIRISRLLSLSLSLFYPAALLLQPEQSLSLGSPFRGFCMRARTSRRSLSHCFAAAA